MNSSSPTIPGTITPDTEQVRFMGMDYCTQNMSQLIDFLQWQIRADKPFSYVVTPNVDHIVRLHKEPQLRSLYDEAGHVVCDSRILELLAIFEGKSLPVIPGSDLTAELISNHIQSEERVVVIGGTPDILETLVRDYDLQNIAWHDPPMGLRNKPEAVERAARFVIENNQGFAFLCVGSPQQEMIANKIVELGGGKGVGLCCGASLDFLGGKTKRAPLWMQNMRLEWLYRLLSEPKRMWRRYLVEGPKIFRIWLRTKNA